jgi:hypothetical protein
MISFVFDRFVVSVILSDQSCDDVLDTIDNRLRDFDNEMHAEQYEINLVNFNLYSILVMMISF